MKCDKMRQSVMKCDEVFQVLIITKFFIEFLIYIYKKIATYFCNYKLMLFFM